jgi:hypothetical protein
VVLSNPLLRNWSTLESLQNQTIHTLKEIPDHGNDRSYGRPPVQQQKRLSPAESVALIQTYKAGAGILDLAKTYGIHRTTVTGQLRRMGIPPRVRGRDAMDLEQAAVLYQAGASLKSVGERYGCDAETVRQALIGAGVQMRPRRGWRY